MYIQNIRKQYKAITIDVNLSSYPKDLISVNYDWVKKPIESTF